MHECMLNESVKEAASLVVKNTSSRTRHTGCPSGEILAPSLTSLDKLTLRVSIASYKMGQIRFFRGACED